MSIQKVTTITFVLSILFILNGFKATENVKLKVEVTDFENKAATKIFVSVFSETGFLEKSIQTKSVIASGNKITVEFELPPGDYAVSTYHDVNSNDKLDRYIIGKPKEPYGFSNNIKPFGRPSFKNCKFTLTNSSKTISIKLLN